MSPVRDREYASLQRNLAEAQAAIREWFAAEEAFDAIGIDGFDKPPEWCEARDRCRAAVGRLRGVLYDDGPVERMQMDDGITIDWYGYP